MRAIAARTSAGASQVFRSSTPPSEKAARNLAPMAASPPAGPARGQVAGQRLVERRSGLEERVVDAARGAALPEEEEVRLQVPLVGGPDLSGVQPDAEAGRLQVPEDGPAREGELQL